MSTAPSRVLPARKGLEELADRRRVSLYVAVVVARPGGPTPLDAGTPNGVRSGALDRPATGGPPAKGQISCAPADNSPTPSASSAANRTASVPHEGAQQVLPSEGWQRWVRVRGHRRARTAALNNRLLVALSCPDATLVAGFRAWLSMGTVDSCVDRFESFLDERHPPEVGEPALLRQLGPTTATVRVLDPCGCLLGRCGLDRPQRGAHAQRCRRVSSGSPGRCPCGERRPVGP